MSETPQVTIAGAGIAGLAAALRLAERGYRVKVYERTDLPGGVLGSRPSGDGAYLDVYPHMYLGWYHNFWRLLSDVSNRDREQLFAPFTSVKQLRRGEFPNFASIVDMYSLWRSSRNLFSGAGPMADMFVFGYATIDLLAERRNPTMLPDNVTVGGFLNARPYMTERAAAAFDSFITTVWAIPSYLVSAEDYRTYLDYSIAEPGPSYWLARGSGFDQVIKPVAAAVKKAGVELVTTVQLTSVSWDNGRVSEIGLQKTKRDPRTGSWVGTTGRWTEPVDELILAVPAPALSRLVRSGRAGATIVDADPRVAELARMRTQRIPILNLFFNRRLRHIPPEPVGLYQAKYGLAFTDISKTWRDRPDFDGRTVLALSASDPFGLPGTSDDDDAMAMLRELAEYLEFDPGERWGASPDVDWDCTRYDVNNDAQLFVNETGTDAWRPEAVCPGLVNLAFAGDFCRNRMGMTTIESAVTSGLEAAQAVVQRRGGDPITITMPRTRMGLRWVWLRYALSPYAAAAKSWSWWSDAFWGSLERAGIKPQRRDS